MRYIVFALALLFVALPDFTYAGSDSNAPSQLLDINAANAAILADRLPGIGPAKAARIVQWRAKNGAFKHIEQLQEVKGIGPKTIDKLRPYIRVGTDAAARQMRMQYNVQEEKTRAGIQRLVNAALHSARPMSIKALPSRVWYRKSILDIVGTH
ncbi:MAG: ComEA family DNA-binding protein [Granulosicoccus sp.]